MIHRGSPIGKMCRVDGFGVEILETAFSRPLTNTPEEPPLGIRAFDGLWPVFICQFVYSCDAFGIGLADWDFNHAWSRTDLVAQFFPDIKQLGLFRLRKVVPNEQAKEG